MLTWIVVPLVFALIAGYVIERTHAVDAVEELTGWGDLLWVLLLVVVGGGFAALAALQRRSRRHSEAASERRIAKLQDQIAVLSETASAAAGDSRELRDDNEKLRKQIGVVERSYAARAMYSVVVWELLIALHYGRIRLSLPDVSADVDELCLKLPAKTMSAALGAEVPLSIWVEDGENIVMVAGPETLKGHAIPKRKAAIYRDTIGFPQRPTRLSSAEIHRLFDELTEGDEPEGFELLAIDDLKPDSKRHDVSLFCKQGYRSMRAYPMFVDGQRAWLVALCTCAVIQAAETHHVRCIGNVLEFAATRPSDPGEGQGRKRRGFRTY